MKYKLTTLLLVAAVALATLSALSVTRPDPVRADSGPGTPWPIDGYGPRPSDDVVLKWDEQLLQTIRANPPTTGPTITARALGVVHTAIYDAWAPYDPVAKGTRLGSSQRQPAAQRTLANKSKAISFAAYTALNDLFPDAQFHRKASYDQLMADLGYSPTDTSTPAMIGVTAAQALLNYRHNDGSNQLNGYADTTGYQPVNTWDRVNDRWRWQPLCVLTAAGVAAGKPHIPADGNCTAPNYSIQKALTPHWGRVTPFSALPPSQYRVTGPPKNPNGTYSTAEIGAILQETSNLSDVNKARAEYWADGPRSEFPPGHMAVFAQALSRKRGFSLDTNVKMFFALGNTMMDASYASWYQKYKYDYVRPVTAIRVHYQGQQINSWLGPNQGYGPVPGEQWRPYQDPTVVTPPFPEYVSGHSTFSGGGATILFSYTGSDTFGATVTMPAGSSRFEPGNPPAPVTLSWASFSEASNDAGMSRRWGGIHFYTGDWHGRALGRQVAQYVWAKAQDYIAGRTPG